MHRWRKGRLGVWLRRYLPAEAVGTLTAVASASVASALGSSVPLAVYVAALGENLGYYATMFAREFVTQMHTRESGRMASAYTTVKNLVLEFGPAEVLDSALVRPGAMWACTTLVGSTEAGVLLGKFAADAVFYVPTIVSYELRRARLRI